MQTRQFLVLSGKFGISLHVAVPEANDNSVLILSFQALGVRVLGVLTG